MRVLHIDSEKSWRGGEQQVAYLIGELREKYDVENIVAAPAGSKLEEFAHKEKLPFIPLSFGGLQIKASFELKKYCRENHIDIIHMHAAKAHTVGVYSAVLGNKVPLILSKRTDFPVRDNFISKFKYNYKGIRKILCVSDMIRKILNKSLKDTSKSITVHSGINPDRFDLNQDVNYLKRKYNVSGKILIGNTSALADHKDYFTFLKTAQFLVERNKNLEFFIIGDGPLKEELKAYAKRLDIDHKVHFTGFLNNLEVVLPELDFFLMTSKEEGLGTSILDAFACKVPMIATAAGGIPEIVIHGRTGYLAKVKDFVSLGEGLLHLLANPDQKKRLVDNAYKLATIDFNRSVTAKKTYEAYKECLK